MSSDFISALTASPQANGLSYLLEVAVFYFSQMLWTFEMEKQILNWNIES